MASEEVGDALSRPRRARTGTKAASSAQSKVLDFITMRCRLNQRFEMIARFHPVPKCIIPHSDRDTVDLAKSRWSEIAKAAATFASTWLGLVAPAITLTPSAGCNPLMERSESAPTQSAKP